MRVVSTLAHASSLAMPALAAVALITRSVFAAFYSSRPAHKIPASVLTFAIKQLISLAGTGRFPGEPLL